MGQCVSRKAAGAFAASTALSHNRPTKMQKHHQLVSPDDENNKKPPPSPIDQNKRLPGYSRGVAMSFGFRRRPATAPSIAANPSAARRLANPTTNMTEGKDRNGNEDAETDALTNNVAPTGRSTPRLAPPKKEANATTRVSRFGFRHNPTNRLNKVADLNSAPAVEFGEKPARLISPTTDNPSHLNGNNNLRRPQVFAATVSRNNDVVRTTMDSNRNTRMKGGIPQPQIGKFTLQSTNLPRPESIRVIESKSAKTLANNSRRTAGMYQQLHHNNQVEDNSSKDGSLTEDSGVGSHLSGYLGENEGLPEVPRFESSPTFGVRKPAHPRSRALEILVTGKNTFDVQDLDGSVDSIGTPPPLPQLPSAFNNSQSNNRNSYQTSTGLVQKRTLEYQRHLDWDNRGRRKISATSSEGFSDDYGEEEKTFRDRFRSEKTFIKAVPHKTFLKTKSTTKEGDSSPASSDEHEWNLGGEAMADDISFSMSSSDESKVDKKIDELEESDSNSVPISTVVIGTALQSMMSSSLSTAFTNSKEVKNVLLTIEDPKFAAVAAASNSGSLLDDELLSPVESLNSYSETEDILKKRLDRASSSESKDVNEKLTPPSPGTPTNATNSLSLSDGKDDFLIDDEIADQPSLIFEDGVGANNDNYSLSQNNSENTATIVDSTPKSKRRSLPAIEGSPLLNLRHKRFSHNRTVSLDTLSPCESIASDDLMMDYDVSQSSGLDDLERRGGGFHSLNETIVPRSQEVDTGIIDKDLTIPACEKFFKSSSRTRLLNRSRTGTPNSIPDSPRSLDSRIARSSARPTSTSSPIKSRLSHVTQPGYDSDDSIRLDRTNHTAIKQDIISIKTMLLKLRRVLNEADEELLMRSDTHNPFDSQSVLTNGLFNSLCPSDNELSAQGEDNFNEARFELAELRRQVLFLQGQLEDKEKTVQTLQEQMIQLVNQNYQSNSAPASTVAADHHVCNAATQTERIRPISAGPSLLNGSSSDGATGSLVSASESPSQRRSRHHNIINNHHNNYSTNHSNHGDISLAVTNCPNGSAKRPRSRLWRQPGEPPSPPRYSNNASSIPRRATSRTRTSAPMPT